MPEEFFFTTVACKRPATQSFHIYRLKRGELFSRSRTRRVENLSMGADDPARRLPRCQIDFPLIERFEPQSDIQLPRAAIAVID
jgi:hypothetical protein